MFYLQASAQLKEAIEKLYDVFSIYPLAPEMDVCRCCNRVEHIAVLYSQPLRECGREELDYYAFCALTTMGDVTAFKHFLPRLLELAVAVEQDQRLLTDLEVITGKLTYGHWNKWPQEERAAIQSFLHQLWGNTLTIPYLEWDVCMDVQSVFNAIACAEDSLEPYLQMWLDSDTLTSCLTIAELLLETDIAKGGKAEDWNWLDDRKKQYEEFQQWILSAAVAEKLERSAVRWANTQSRNKFINARKMNTGL